MIRAYDENVSFIAAGSTPESVARFEPSQATKNYVFGLIHKEKMEGLTAQETVELDNFMRTEHIKRLAKPRGRTIVL